MTDEQIEKALEYCTEGNLCDGCPYRNGYAECVYSLPKYALALIRRQKAQLVEQMLTVDAECDKCIAEAKAEAIRTLQDRLAMHFGTYTDKDTVSVRDVFKLISKISEDILEEQK